MSKTATFIKRVNGTGDGRVFRLSEPISDYDGTTYDHVWVSASVVPYSGAETYIFGADAEGNVLNWGELPGSYRGGLDHAEALRRAGYEVSA